VRGQIGGLFAEQLDRGLVGARTVFPDKVIVEQFWTTFGPFIGTYAQQKILIETENNIKDVYCFANLGQVFLGRVAFWTGRLEIVAWKIRNAPDDIVTR
jgi:hypothetical protein